MFIPPINLGQFQPSPATIAEWVYQIWQFLQDNPIATETEIREFIQSELTQSETVANAIEDYLTENPPPAPVQSVQGKTGAVQLAYNDIVTSSNAVPVYKASSTPNTSTLVGQYNIGYRLFVNTTTQEIYTISPAGALSLVGRGMFDGTTIDLNTTDGDTTIAEAVNSKLSNVRLYYGEYGQSVQFDAGGAINVESSCPEVELPSGYEAVLTFYYSNGSTDIFPVNFMSSWFRNVATTTKTATFRRVIMARTRE